MLVNKKVIELLRVCTGDNPRAKAGELHVSSRTYAQTIQ